ncbi:MAG: rhomboid family intramembrane serine protease [Actinomycetota bacterium]
MALSDDTTCYRHPDRLAAVACQRCERPICPDCMTQASVGFHCPEDAKAGAQRVVRARDIGGSDRPPITVGLIAISVVAYVLQQSGLVINDRTVTTAGLLFGPSVAEGEWWRIVTSAFLHGSLIHIGFNMYILWVFGRPLEEGLGRLRFLLAYVAGMLGGSAAVLLFNYDAPTLGASGAVLGLAGAMSAVLWVRRGIPITQNSLFGLIVINLALPLLVPRISFWGHLGGVLAGLAAGWLLTAFDDRGRQPSNVGVAATAGLCVVLAGLALAAPTLVG